MINQYSDSQGNYIMTFISLACNYCISWYVINIIMFFPEKDWARDTYTSMAVSATMYTHPFTMPHGPSMVRPHSSRYHYALPLIHRGFPPHHSSCLFDCAE